MATFTPTDTVLVTGANGHVATHLISQLLALPSGPRVRASVRSSSSRRTVEQLFGPAITSGQLTIIDVPDMTAAGAFDDAVTGISHIAHVASPLVLAPDDIERDLLQPALRGTTGLLDSAARCGGATLQRVVITSSFAAVFNPLNGWPQKGRVYSGADWNPISLEQAMQASAAAAKGEELPSMSRYTGFGAYLLSKKAAERAAWDFYEEGRSKGAFGWTLSVVNPMYIGGPSLVPLSKGADGSVKGLTFSQELLYRVASGGEQMEDFPGWIDVRDVARAHVQALLRDEAQGGRWILTVGLTGYSDIADAARRTSSFKPRDDLPKVDSFTVERQSALDALAINKWRSVDELVGDLLKQIEAL